MSESKPIALQVRPRGKPIRSLPEYTFALPLDNARNLYERVAAKSRFDINRLRITKGSDGSHIPNSREHTIDSLGLYDQSTIMVKDLGPQIAWRTVFLIEYLGPLLIHPLFYYYRSSIYSNHKSVTSSFTAPSTSATISYYMIMLHFLKREFETMFIHRFSNATMPAFNIFKNSAHYWLLAGLNIALFTYSPSVYSPTSRDPPVAWLPYAAIALFLIGELGNLSAHLTLMGLRTQGGSERGIPVSGVYKFIPVTCPNYFFEALAWAGIWMANRSLSTGLFALVAIGQMAVWARKKEFRYRQEFGDRYKKKRYGMLPLII